MAKKIPQNISIDAHELSARLKFQNNGRVSQENEWKSGAKFLDTFAMLNNNVIFLWDQGAQRYVYISDRLNTLSGISPVFIIDDKEIKSPPAGLHPKQVKALVLFNKLCTDYVAENINNYKNLLFTVNYLHKNSDDEYIQLLQRTIILECDIASHPILYLNLVQQVGHIKKHNSISCVISAGDKFSIYNYNPHSKTLTRPRGFSKRERKILELLALGFDTKQIAKKLFISPLTVGTHRKNLIKKTDCLDTTGVVDYAKLIKLIS